jgi:uncharacterized protein (DUF1501 family)
MMPPPSCSGPLSRRAFLRAGTLALGGLTLPGLLAARESAGRTGAETSVILFWMWGGPSQLETYDPKPAAPAEYRGPFRSIRTTVPGLDVCELLPLQAKLAKRIALVRSLHHTMSSHNDGSIEVLTGKTPERPDPTSTALSSHPDFGMLASKVRGVAADGLPRYIGIPNQPFMTRPAYLGLGHQAFNAGNPAAPGYAPPHLALVGGVNPAAFDDRRQLLGQFDALRREVDVQARLDGADKVRAAALQMLANPRIAAAFDLNQEDPKLRDRYGRHLWGQSCLLARRLAQAGAAVITIDALAPEPGQPLYFSWDDHANAQPGWDLAKGMRWRAPFLDQALSALIEDVYDRGLDRNVLVVAMGEFGRTPRLGQSNGCIGRDHWPDAQCALLSGGGLRVGQVVGSTDAHGAYPKDCPLTPKDLLATIYRHLDIDPRLEFKDFSGRPIPILSEGEPIRALE